MEFWGVEVKAGQKLMVQPEIGQLIHISQASVGEVKDGKGAKSFPLRLKVDDKNFVLGTLSTEDRTQAMFDLVFEKDFELSHDWKHGSIYFMGYVADDPSTEGSEFSDSDDSAEEDEPVVPAAVEAKENGVAKVKSGAAKPVLHDVKKVAAAAEGKKVDEPGKKVDDPESDDDDDSEDESDDEMALDGSPEADSDDVSDDDTDEDSGSEEELPTAQQSKKRPAPSAEKTPVAKKAKEAKAPSPAKSGKKVQNTTPVNPKSAGKTPNKSKGQSPKSAAQLSCKSCTKTFTSETAMNSHAKAKHGGK